MNILARIQAGDPRAIDTIRPSSPSRSAAAERSSSAHRRRKSPRQPAREPLPQKGPSSSIFTAKQAFNLTPARPSFRLGVYSPIRSLLPNRVFSEHATERHLKSRTCPIVGSRSAAVFFPAILAVSVLRRSMLLRRRIPHCSLIGANEARLMNAKIRFLLAAFLSAILALSSSLSLAAALEPGDIVITTQIGPAANNDFGLVVVDPTTGNRTILSDNTTGSGPAFTLPEGVAVEPDGDILVADLYGGPQGDAAVFRVDPATGNRTIVSSSGGVGTGATMHTPYGLLESGGTIYVADAAPPSFGAILAIDPLSGNRSVFSGPSVGVGALIPEPIGIAQEGQTLLVTAYLGGGVAHVDSTGDRFWINVGTFPVFRRHRDRSNWYDLCRGAN